MIDNQSIFIHGRSIVLTRKPASMEFNPSPSTTLLHHHNDPLLEHAHLFFQAIPPGIMVETSSGSLDCRKNVVGRIIIFFFHGDRQQPLHGG